MSNTNRPNIPCIVLEVVQHALEDYSHVNDWYMRDSVMTDEYLYNQLLQFLGDLQEIQFHLPSHGQDLDSHWPTQADSYDGILVNGNLRIPNNDMPERPSTPIPKKPPPTHSQRYSTDVVCTLSMYIYR